MAATKHTLEEIVDACLEAGSLRGGARALQRDYTSTRERLERAGILEPLVAKLATFSKPKQDVDAVLRRIHDFSC